MDTTMTIEKYLSDNSKNHRIDKIIIKWFRVKNGLQYEEKTKTEWDIIVDSFFKNTEI